MTKDEVARREAAARILLNSACEVDRHQLGNGCHVVHERPAAVCPWAEAPIKELMADARVGSVVGHQCRYGQRAQAGDGA